MTDQIWQSINRLVPAFPRQEISPETIASYVEDLSDIPPDVLEGICRRLRLTEEWFPSVAKIRSLWFETVCGPANPSDALAWCVREMNAVGTGYSPMRGEFRVEPVFPDPVCAEAIRLFGWNRLFLSDPEWAPREWGKVYQEARDVVMNQFMRGDLALHREMALPAEKSMPLRELAAESRRRVS